MSFAKWIGASVGWSFGGPIGAIIGLALGSLVDNSSVKFQTQKRARSQTQSGDFEVSLLILASLVIKADGKQDRRELDFVRRQFVQMYGKARANQAFRLFKAINQQSNISLRQVCLQIKQMMDHASRLQLLHFLFGIAKADGAVAASEVSVIEQIAQYLRISANDFQSIKAMFYSSQANAYKILEIEKGASPQAIKKAYRKMAKKFHPDKVQHLGEVHQKGAEEKFRKVQEAYEQLQSELGF
jgi:DnaJ like chaperone protein|tara:strand:+ start:1828 stop:2553 length:726 start_codon:yes stop_codon:yes gene_type:complete